MYFILIILALQNNRNEVEFPVISIYKYCVCQKCPGGISVLDGKVDLMSLHSLKSLEFGIGMMVRLNLNHTYLPPPSCFPYLLSLGCVAHG